MNNILAQFGKKILESCPVGFKRFGKTTVVVVVCFLLMKVSLEAQTLTGKVLGVDSEPINNATIIIQTPDSVFVNATITDSLGYFSIILEDISSFRLVVNHLLYESFEEFFSDFESKTIKLTERQYTIADVVVTGERPFVRVIDGKLTYDIPHLLENRIVQTAYEVLLQLPGVREQGGGLVLAGASRVTVLINGQLLSMPQQTLLAALRMQPANIIQTVEVMYSAPPQYHVRGAAINIIITGGSADGLQGQINAAYEQRYYSNYNAGISFLFSRNNLTVEANYGYSYNRNRTGHDLFSNHYLHGIIHNIEQFNSGRSKNEIHNIRLNARYNFSNDNRLNFTYASRITSGMRHIERSIGNLSNSENIRSHGSPVQFHNLLLNHRTGFGLSVGTEYTYYRNHLIQNFRENIENFELNFSANSQQTINRFRFFADQSHTLESNWRINYGAQFIYAEDNSFQRYNFQFGSDISATNTENINYEHTANMYIGFEKSFGERFSLSSSITGEFYSIGSFREWTLFPRLQTTYVISPTQMLLLSFSSNKIYPSYWEFHGAVGYLNRYAEVHGNTGLKPYNEYSVQLNYILRNRYIITGFYTYQNRYAAQLPYQSQNRLALIYKTMNFDYRQRAGVNFTIPFRLSNILDSRLALLGFYENVKSSHFHDTYFNNENFVFYTRFDNTVNLSRRRNIRMEVVGAYITKNIQGPAILTNIWHVDLGFMWSFFHDMAELRLRGNDLFNSWSPNMSMRYSNQDLRMRIFPDSRNISLSFTFRFGGYQRSENNVDDSRFGIR